MEQNHIKLETVVSSRHPRLVEPEKPAEMDSHKDFVVYGGRNFAVPSNWLGYLRRKPFNIQMSNELAVEGGMMTIEEDGRYGCMYCNHLDNGPMKRIAEGEGVQVFNVDGEPGIYVEGCSYSNEDLRSSTRFTGPRKKVIDAWTTPCVVRDSEIAHLVDSGQLDDFEVDRVPEDLPAIRDLHMAQVKKRSQGVVRRALGYVGRLLFKDI
ncbi:MAG: hypothetical protein KKF56_00095 [Nanoarchaeota archaeon]|nr:hypothetical protein [Nanoarchaeota archaeon]